ncbi:unnamed protein product, partial [Prorocentrum cordatum]
AAPAELTAAAPQPRQSGAEPPSDAAQRARGAAAAAASGAAGQQPAQQARLEQSQPRLCPSTPPSMLARGVPATAGPTQTAALEPRPCPATPPSMLSRELASRAGQAQTAAGQGAQPTDLFAMFARAILTQTVLNQGAFPLCSMYASMQCAGRALAAKFRIAVEPQTLLNIAMEERMPAGPQWPDQVFSSRPSLFVQTPSLNFTLATSVLVTDSYENAVRQSPDRAGGHSPPSWHRGGRLPLARAPERLRARCRLCTRPVTAPCNARTLGASARTILRLADPTVTKAPFHRAYFFDPIVEGAWRGIGRAVAAAAPTASPEWAHLKPSWPDSARDGARFHL